MSFTGVVPVENAARYGFEPGKVYLADEPNPFGLTLRQVLAADPDCRKQLAERVKLHPEDILYPQRLRCSVCGEEDVPPNLTWCAADDYKHRVPAHAEPIPILADRRSDKLP